jgi:hypothetical protein
MIHIQTTLVIYPGSPNLTIIFQAPNIFPRRYVGHVIQIGNDEVVFPGKNAPKGISEIEQGMGGGGVKADFFRFTGMNEVRNKLPNVPMQQICGYFRRIYITGLGI